MKRPPAAPNVRQQQARRLFLTIVLHIVWWDVILNRPVLRRFRSAPLPRWTALARRYVEEAQILGGVLIKLGQYAGARMDLLPGEVTSVLGALHDTVPAAPTAAVIAQIEADFGCPMTELFISFEPRALAASSLAQVHRAQLQDGSPVAVKVLRPGIAAIVEADLAVVRRAIGLLGRFKGIARRTDLRLLFSELARVTRLELDCQQEGRNAERFADAFKDGVGIRAPRIF